MEKKLHLSVHDVVDFLLRKGDIDNRVFNKSSMQEGTFLHALYQSKQDSGNYISEYYLKQTFNIGDIEIDIEGRADGIIVEKNGYCIDEIKTTVIDLDTFRKENLEWHLGQAKMYAYMFMKEKGLDEIGVKLTYIRQGNIKEKLIDKYRFNFAEIETFAYGLLEEYLSFYQIIFRHLEKRKDSIDKLKFPFDKYRKGQKELMKKIYDNIVAKSRIYIEAPTGIGKTISSIFPSIKLLNEEDESKLFYLTAKNSGKIAANNAVSILKDKGLSANSVTITAKEKICMSKQGECNPDECPYARHYYDKIQSVIRYALLNYDNFDLATIKRIAIDNQICPFEFELDLSLFCDIVICDYNYLFDPMSHMQRYFDMTYTNHIALIDEAHNLVDRSRDMYSASFTNEEILKCKKALKHLKIRKYKSAINNLLEIMVEESSLAESEYEVVSNFSREFFKRIDKYLTVHKDVSKDKDIKLPKEASELFISANRFYKISEFYDTNYVAYIKKEGKVISYNYYCLDASCYVNDSLNKLRASVLFSATLSPLPYFIKVLGGNEESDHLSLASPFNTNKFKLLVAPTISVKYKNRDLSCDKVVEYIHNYISGKVGNYFIYVPSFEYLEKLKEKLKFDDVNIYVQEKDMSDEEKDEFISHFSITPEKSNLALAVLGGTFSEGIDLVSDRLIGVVIIGIGLPKINFNSDNIRKYYDEKEEMGYVYAYINPGINKITQAIGRVIRSENDIGSALLIDERYTQYRYRDLFKKKYPNYEIVIDKEDILKTIKDFYQRLT